MGFSLGSILPVATAAIGYSIGGPSGAMYGAQLGSALGGAVASNDAARVQNNAYQQALNAQQEQMQYGRDVLNPYLQAGQRALTGQMDYLGFNGGGNQQSFINGILNSSEYQTALKEMQRGLLQNAAATGGLRGGDLQAALAQLGPDLLNKFVQQRYNQLGNLSVLGQQTGVGLAGQAQTYGNNAANLYGNMGTSLANSYIAQQTSMSGLNKGFADTYAFLKTNDMLPDWLKPSSNTKFPSNMNDTDFINKFNLKN